MKRIINGNPTHANSTRDIMGITSVQMEAIIYALQSQFCTLEALKDFSREEVIGILQENGFETYPFETLTSEEEKNFQLGKSQRIIIEILEVINAPYQIVVPSLN